MSAVRSLPGGKQTLGGRPNSVAIDPTLTLAEKVDESLFGPSDTAVDFTAKRSKIDGLGQECLGAAFQGFSPRISVAVSGNHDDGNIRSCGSRLRQKFKAAHSGHVDVGQDQDQRCTCGVADALKGAIPRLGKIHREAAGAEVAPKLLAK